MGCGSAVNLENHEKKWKLRPNVNPFLIIKTLTLIFKSSIVLFFQKTNPALFYTGSSAPFIAIIYLVYSFLAMMASICLVSKESLKEDELKVCDTCNCRTSRHKTVTEIAEFERLQAETERLRIQAETERLRNADQAETERLRNADREETERLRIQADVEKTMINARWRTGLTGKKLP